MKNRGIPVLFVLGLLFLVQSAMHRSTILFQRIPPAVGLAGSCLVVLDVGSGRCICPAQTLENAV